MKREPLVSVVMPAYNAERFVAKAVRSILEQTYASIELLVADDGSNDDTRAILDGFLTDKRVRAYHNEANLGYLKTSNRLFALCQGDFITFMDADDWSHPERLQLLVNGFEKDPELCCAGSYVMRVDENDNQMKEVTFDTEYPDIKGALPQRFSFVGSAVMLRRDVFDLAGPYPEVFDRIGSEDLYWIGKIIHRHKMINIPKALYYYRESKQSVSFMNNKKIDGQLSNELVQIALHSLMKKGRDILIPENRKFLEETMNYLRMKYNFWNNNYYAGFRYWLKGIGKKRMDLTDRNRILKMYSRKWAKSLFTTG
jgi:glycosyltransferase involved in cell wall biosynthesis